MKKVLLLALCVVLLCTSVAFSETVDAEKATTAVTEENGVVTVTTVYNLSLFNDDELPKYEVEKSDDSEAESAVINERVAHRAKNAVVIQIGNYAAVANDLLEWIDKDNKNVVPYIKESRTMVPLRYIAEKLGATVGFDDVKREVSITLNEKVFKVVIGESKYTVNDKEYMLDAPAEIVESRTFVPLRVISEAFNKDVTWIENGRYVIVTPLDYPWDVENSIDKETLNRISLMVSPLVRDLAYGLEK